MGTFFDNFKDSEQSTESNNNIEETVNNKPVTEEQLEPEKESEIIYTESEIKEDLKSTNTEQNEDNTKKDTDTNALIQVSKEGKVMINGFVNSSLKCVDLSVKGSLQGKVTVKNKVEINENSQIIGDVTCKEMHLKGIVKGDVSCENIKLEKKAKIIGSISCE